MASSLRLLVVMLLIMCAAFSASASTSATDDPSTAAARLLDHMEAGRFAEATSGFDDKMKAVLDAEKLEQVQHQLEGAGLVQRRGALICGRRDLDGGAGTTGADTAVGANAPLDPGRWHDY